MRVYSCSNEMYLRRHTKRHSESNVKCPLCQKVSPNRAAMRSHMRMHKHTHKCSICEKSFARALGLKVYFLQSNETKIHETI